jgi:hypothetical protein
MGVMFFIGWNISLRSAHLLFERTRLERVILLHASVNKLIATQCGENRCSFQKSRKARFLNRCRQTSSAVYCSVRKWEGNRRATKKRGLAMELERKRNRLIFNPKRKVRTLRKQNT